MEELCNVGTKLTTVDKDEWKKYVIPNVRGREFTVIMRMPDGTRERITLDSDTLLKVKNTVKNCVNIFLGVIRVHRRAWLLES